MAVQTFLGAIFNQVSLWETEDRLEEELYPGKPAKTTPSR
jgi:hypothetical protein